MKHMKRQILSLVVISPFVLVTGCASPMGFKLFGPGSEYECTVKEAQNAKATNGLQQVEKNVQQDSSKNPHKEHSAPSEEGRL